MEPERGVSGRYAKYVWGFVNRVAREVGKQHPDRVITCCAYGGYKSVPTEITFEPNVSVTLCRNFAGSGGNYECYRNPRVMQESNDLLKEWSQAVSNVYIWDYHNLRWNRMMKGVPVVAPHGIAHELRHDYAAGVKGHIVEYNTISYYYEDIVAVDLILGVRHSGSNPPVVYFDDFSLMPVSGDGVEDANGDGCFDKAVVWADHLPPCDGVVSARGGVIVLCPPDVLFLADRDGDGNWPRCTVITSTEIASDGWILFGPETRVSRCVLLLP